MKDSELRGIPPEEFTPPKVCYLLFGDYHAKTNEELNSLVEKVIEEGDMDAEQKEWLQDTYKNGGDSDKNDIALMAFIHYSPYRDLLLQYAKERKLAGRQPHIHNIADIMMSYSRIFKV